MKLKQLFSAGNTINTQGDIEAFYRRHEPRSLDALLICNCTDARLLDMARELLRTGGVLALRGGDTKILVEVFEKRWRHYFCGDEKGLIWTRICRQEGSSEVLWEDLPLGHYMDLLQQGVPFSYLRYGDGEWNCALETLCPGYGFQTFTPELCKDVQTSLIEYHRDPRYIMTLAPVHHFRDRGLYQWELIATFLREHGLQDIKWGSTQPFNYASETGTLWPFIQYLQQHNIIIVGPARYGALRKIFPGAAFVIIPDKHCHRQLPGIQRDILAQKRPAIILITAGPACVVLIHRLFKEIGDRSTMIDIGSMWAPYIGQTEHGAHLRMAPTLIARNLGRGQ